MVVLVPKKLRIALSDFLKSMNKKILCSSPVILRNPRLKFLISRYRNYTMNGHEVVLSLDDVSRSFPEWIFSPRRLGVTVDDLDKYFIVDKHTGTIYPIFISVPCGKCLCCRAKSAADWSFRAMCENVHSTSQPLFLTLTYNNAHLPSNGVFKEELQLFFKRLRTALDRKGIEHNIRYFAVAEYGSKSGRPHYHAILWNFPSNSFGSLHQVLTFVERAWSVPTGEYNVDGSPIVSSLGFAYCVPAERGCIGYVMKYMRKPPKVPKGMNNVFFLSSKKGGGIGSKYIRSLIPFYYDNPQVLDISVTDPYSGQTITKKLSGYAKTQIFPCISRVVDKFTRDTFSRLLDKIAIRFAVSSSIIGDNRLLLSSVEVSVLKKFSFLDVYLPFSPCPRLRSNIRSMSFLDRVDYLTRLNFEIDDLCRYLSLVDLDTDYIASRARALDVRNNTLSALPELDVDISELEYRLNNANLKAESLELL